MFTKNTVVALAALLSAWTAGSSTALAGDWQFDANASAGTSYDSNVGIEEVDSNSGEADSVLALAAGGAVTYVPGNRPFALRLGYDYSGTSHSRFEIFDLDLHHGFAAIEYRSTAFDAALILDRYVGVLDGANYVSIEQVSPSIARLFGDHVYLRAAWLASTRDYASLPRHDAKNAAGRIDTYLLLDDLHRYVSLSIQFSRETAFASEFDYEGYQVALAYAHTFTLPDMRLKLKSSLRYEDRDYVATAVVLAGEARRDRRWRAGLDAEVPFSEQVSLHATLEQTDNRSNLESARLDKFLAGVELRVAF